MLGFKLSGMRIYYRPLLTILFCLATLYLSAQNKPDSLLQDVTLQTAVDYSIKHQPVILQSLADQEITEANIRSRLAELVPAG